MEDQVRWRAPEVKGEAQPGHELPHERGLLGLFLERAISLRTMDGPLRLAMGLALAQLLAAAVLIPLRGVDPRSVGLFAPGTQPAWIPQAVFWFSVGSLAMAWTYLLGGALESHPGIGILGLALFTASLYPGYEQVASVPALVAPALALLVALWAVGLIRARWSHREAAASAGRLGHGGMASLGALFALVLGIHLAIWNSVRAPDQGRLFALGFTVELASLSLFLVPVLTLVGGDFGEWADLMGSRLAGLTDRMRGSLALAGVAATVAAALCAWALLQLRWRAAPELILAVIAAGLIALAARAPRAARAREARVPFAALVAVAVAFFALSYGLAARANAGASSGVQLGATYRHPGSPSFQIAYPSGWHPTSTSAGGISVTTFTNGFAAFWVVEVPPGQNGSPVPALKDWLGIVAPKLHVHAGPTAARGGWTVTAFTAAQAGGRATYAGTGWARVAGGRLWLLYGQTSGALLPVVLPYWRSMVASWTPTRGGVAPGGGALGRTASRSAEDWLLGWAAVAALIVVLVLLPALVLGRVPERFRGAALFAFVASLLFALNELPSLGSLLGSLSLPALSLVGLQAFVATATLAFVGWRAVRRRLADSAESLALLLTLNIALQVLAWLYRLYSQGESLARLSIAQALVILFALVWDVVVSGERITNRHGRLVPRHSRVLLYLGYIMLVATAVLFFSAVRGGAGGSAHPLFESEMWPQIGLVLLGVPFVVTLCASRLVGRPVQGREPGEDRGA